MDEYERVTMNMKGLRWIWKGYDFSVADDDAPVFCLLMSMMTLLFDLLTIDLLPMLLFWFVDAVASFLVCWWCCCCCKCCWFRYVDNDAVAANVAVLVCLCWWCCFCFGLLMVMLLLPMLLLWFVDVDAVVSVLVCWCCCFCFGLLMLMLLFLF